MKETPGKAEENVVENLEPFSAVTSRGKVDRGKEEKSRGEQGKMRRDVDI